MKTPSKKSIIIGTVIFLIAFLAYPSFLLGLFFRDIGSIDDSDLTYEKIDVPQEQNAYYDLISLEKGGVVYPDKNIQECLADEKCIKEMGDANQENFSVIDKFLAKKYFVNPDYADPLTPSILSVVYNYSAFSSLAYLHPYYLSQQGRDKEAMESVFQMFEVSQKIKSGRPGMMDILVAWALEGKGTDAAQKIIKKANFSSDDLLRYSKKVEDFKEDKNQTLVLIVKNSYLSNKNNISLLTSGRFGQGAINSKDPAFINSSNNNFYFQPNKTRKLFAEEARLEMENQKKPCSSGASSRPFKTVESSRNPFLLRFTPNAAGEILQTMTIFNADSVRFAACKIDSQMMGIRLVFALKAYKQDNGKLPGSLESLVPDYLSSLPNDLFSDDQLIYSPEKKIIYSIGKDFVDDGGDKEKDVVMDIDF